VYKAGNTKSPDGEPGFVFVFPDTAKPIDYEQHYVPMEFYEKVAEEATQYANARYAAAEAKLAPGTKLQGSADRAFVRIGMKFEKEHIIAWRTCRIIMYGLHRVQYPFKLCWSDCDIQGIPAVKEIMTQDLFVAINKYVHFEDLENENLSDATWKYREVVTMLREINQRSCQVGQDLSADEGVADTSSKKVCGVHTHLIGGDMGWNCDMNGLV
jgi:hypothetical protein